MNDLDEKIRKFLEYCEVEKGHSELTIRNYDHYLKRFLKWGSENKIKSPAEINLTKIHEFRLWLNRFVNKNIKSANATRLPRIKKNTQNYHLIALRSFLKYLAKNDIASLSPEKIELSDIDDREINFLEPEELERLLNALDTNTFQGLRDRTILELLFSTGLRVSELVNLNKEQINLDTREFSVSGKGGKSRIVFISEVAKLWLDKYLGQRSDKDKAVFVRITQRHQPATVRHSSNEPAIVSDNGNRKTKDDITSLRLTPRTIQRIISKYSKKAGIIKKVTPHTLRHTFGTDLLRSGADIRAVQQLLGHSSITTTQFYTHVTDQHLKEVHQKFHGKKTV